MFSSLVPGLRPPLPSPSPASLTTATADGTSIAPSSASSATTTSPAPTVTASSPGLPSTATPSSSSVSPHSNINHTRSTSRATTASTSLTSNNTISSQRQIDEARNAVVASIGNLLDRELQGRAVLLHANNAAIEKQERDVARARDALRRENDKLQRLAEENARKVKEIGNVQNWAEMLEREFLIVEETLRLVNGEGSWSGSECGSDCDCGRGDGDDADGDERDGEGDVVMNGADKGKGKDGVDGTVAGDVVAPEMVPIPESPLPRDGRGCEDGY